MNTPTQNHSPGRRLREAWQREPLQVPGVFNPLMGKMARTHGYSAVYLSGAALSASMGLPDVGLVTLTEFVTAARAIVDACGLPLICDADTGFGEALNVERCVQQFEAAGVAAIHLEDQELPKRCGHLSGKSLVDTADMESKIRAAVAARSDPGFVIIARTDARGVTGLDEALRRAEAYLAAGADMLFVEALRSAEEFQEVGRRLRVPLLANMTEFGQGPLLSFQQLCDFGYRVVIYPVTGLRLAMRVAEELLKTLKTDGDQRRLLEKMLTRQELYDYLGYQGYEERDRAYFQITH